MNFISLNIQGRAQKAKKDWVKEICNKNKDMDQIIDEKNPYLELISRRIHVMNSLQDMEKLEASELAQKVKIKWSIEGDENSRFFHGMLNKKRNQQAIRGILKEVGSFPKGGNASFIALIHKMQEARVVKDFRPICLIGSMYKIIAKILVNRLVGVLGGLIHEVKSAFIANRQILDGPFILDELIHWCRSKKKQVLIFKVDFEKAYDSASGLRMNLQKSKLIGISVKDDIVSRAAIKMGCSTLKALFIYLGVKVIGSMARVRSWDEIVEKIKKRLSKWKMNTLSIGGRLTLIKSVLSLTPLYYMSMFKVLSQVLKFLEGIRRKFFIGSDLKENKIDGVEMEQFNALKLFLA
nr:RNA-directed DNA polymerase, eukaryota, reverse transcriptase zinc-binding domain protein [Tanacetum cinerariifolium]